MAHGLDARTVLRQLVGEQQSCLRPSGNGAQAGVDDGGLHRRSMKALWTPGG
jgi:hypothetical protein